uniref:C2 domain-containing protein n=1 Tax=Opuntia streptacantha TaxID=393608 RepID=A0A7C8ZFX6_OPUST
MGYKTLELTLISAKDLKNVNLIGKMDPYVVVYLSDNPNTKQKTPVHQDAGTNPVWNYTMRFTVDEAAAYSAGKYLVFKIKHEQTFGADKELGEVLVSLKELFDGAKGKDSGAVQNLTYQVRRTILGWDWGLGCSEELLVGYCWVKPWMIFTIQDMMLALMIAALISENVVDSNCTCWVFIPS